MKRERRIVKGAALWQGKTQALSFFALEAQVAQLAGGVALFVDALEDFLESVI